MKHTVVWIDQREAKVFDVAADAVAKTFVHSPGPHIHRHAHEQEVKVRNHPDDERRFFEEVASALKGREQILLVGPSKTKLHFLRHLQRNDPALEHNIAAIETVDHPTDGQLVAYLRRHFDEGAPRSGV